MKELSAISYDTTAFPGLTKSNFKITWPTILFIWFTQELDYKAKHRAHTVLKITEAHCSWKSFSSLSVASDLETKWSSSVIIRTDQFPITFKPCLVYRCPLNWKAYYYRKFALLNSSASDKKPPVNMDTSYDPLSVNIKKVWQHHILMNTSE